jgi:hypothetical protein
MGPLEADGIERHRPTCLEAGAEAEAVALVEGLDRLGNRQRRAVAGNRLISMDWICRLVDLVGHQESLVTRQHPPFPQRHHLPQRRRERPSSPPDPTSWPEDWTPVGRACQS